MSFFDFSAVWEFIAITSPIQWVIGVGLVIAVWVGIRWLGKTPQHQIDLFLGPLETLLTIFFLILALPSLVIATAQSGNDPRVIMVALLALMLVHFAKHLIVTSKAGEQTSAPVSEISSGKPISKERTPVPAWATVGVILGVSALVMLRRTKAS